METFFFSCVKVWTSHTSWGALAGCSVVDKTLPLSTWPKVDHGHGRVPAAKGGRGGHWSP